MSLGLVSYGSSDEGETSETDETAKRTDQTALHADKSAQQTNIAAKRTDATVKQKDEAAREFDDNDLMPNDDDEFGFDAELSNSLALKLPPPKFSTDEQLPTEAPIASLVGTGHSAEGIHFSEIPKPSARAALENSEEPELIVEPSSTELALRERPPAKRKTVQIAALSFPVADSDSDDDAPSKKKPAKIGPAKDRKTGLFALLPPVRSSTNVFLPKSVKPGVTVPPSKQQTAAVASKSSTIAKPANSLKRRALSHPASTVAAVAGVGKIATESKFNGVVGSNDSSDEEGDAIETPDFFSLEKRNDPIPNEVEVLDDAGYSGDWSKETERAKPLQQPEVSWSGRNNATVGNAMYEFNSADAEDGMEWGEAGGSNDLYGEAEVYAEGGAAEGTLNPQRDDCFQDEQFLRLQPRRQRGQEIRVVDVHAGEAPSQLDIVKGMTLEVDRPVSHNSKDGPTSQQRRKHQITYLAHQAKEREFQLKNQWAENKFAKRQAQSKYGF